MGGSTEEFKSLQCTDDDTIATVVIDEAQVSVRSAWEVLPFRPGTISARGGGGISCAPSQLPPRETQSRGCRDMFNAQHTFKHAHAEIGAQPARMFVCGFNGATN